MTTPVPCARARTVLLALSVAACGKYANVAQKLDVTARVAGDTWITAVDPSGGSNRTEVRLLLVGKPDTNGTAPFSFSSVYVPVSAGTAVSTLQGNWVEAGSANAATLYVQHEYSYPDESTTRILLRTGTTRSDDQFQIPLTVTRNADQLIVAGDPRLAGTYVALTEALGHLGIASASDAACAFQIANLGMLRSEGRILGFGGPLIQQYSQPATYVGTVEGSLVIHFSGSLSSNTTTITYGAFEDIGGVVVDGSMITDANSSGDGHMSGVMTFTFNPVAADGSAGVPITGTIDYGGGGNPANAIQISGGNPVAGSYTVAIDGGGTAQVACATEPSPSVSDCLALP